MMNGDREVCRIEGGYESEVDPPEGAAPALRAYERAHRSVAATYQHQEIT